MKPKATKTSLEKRKQVDRLLSQELIRFRDVVNAIDGVNEFRRIQDVFSQINSHLRSASLEERREVVEILSRTVGETLIGRGASSEIIRELELRIKVNWLSVLEEEKDPDLRSILRKAIEDWDQARQNIKREKNFKELLMGASRLAVGGGVVVFDAAKFLLVLPAPTYLVSSFISGAVLFMGGVDQLWGRHIDNKK